MPVTRVVIHKNGHVEVEGIGYIGSACEEALQRLLVMLQQLGVRIEVKEHRRKPEYYAASATRQEVGSGW